MGVLATHHVVALCRLSKKQSDEHVPTSGIVLTLALSQLPEFVTRFICVFTCAFQFHNTKLRTLFFCCQKFGHIKLHCPHPAHLHVVSQKLMTNVHLHPSVLSVPVVIPTGHLPVSTGMGCPEIQVTDQLSLPDAQLKPGTTGSYAAAVKWVECRYVSSRTLPCFESRATSLVLALASPCSSSACSFSACLTSEVSAFHQWQVSIAYEHRYL